MLLLLVCVTCGHKRVMTLAAMHVYRWAQPLKKNLVWIEAQTQAPDVHRVPLFVLDISKVLEQVRITSKPAMASIILRL